jgi:spermidine synthase
VLLAVFAIGTCGLIYELLAGTLASYVLGDSVTQFSTIIGVYLFAMGVGAWLSKFIERNLIQRFIEIEIAVALIGGVSATVLFLSFARVEFFRVILYLIVLVIGTLVGTEIPLLMRILQDRYNLKDLVSRVLTVDYLGALVASLAFPLFLVPRLGLVRGSFAVGCLNGAVAIWCTHLMADLLPHGRQAIFLRVEAWCVTVLLVVGLLFSDELTSLAEDELYADPIVYAKTSQYQRIVLTEGRGSFQLYLNGHLQLASVDEHRYHEALVHPPMSVARDLAGREPKRVLVLGGGDGLAVRELLKHRAVEEIALVDLDPMMTDLAASLSFLVQQNERALHDPRVEVINADAMIWLRDEAPKRAKWDVVIADFPDPNSYSLGKLYTTRFYRLAKQALHEDGALVVQATSPMLARRSFWCVARTIEEVGLAVRAYHAPVPSFGEWGYVLAAHRPFEVPSRISVAERLRYLNAETLPTLFVFPADMDRVETEPNSLNNQILVQYYEAEWSRWN